MQANDQCQQASLLGMSSSRPTPAVASADRIEAAAELLALTPVALIVQQPGSLVWMALAAVDCVKVVSAILPVQLVDTGCAGSVHTALSVWLLLVADASCPPVLRESVYVPPSPPPRLLNQL